MKARLKITKDGAIVYAGVCDVGDAASFGAACAEAWHRIRQQEFERQTSIGALMEHLDEQVLARLHGACISLEPL